MNKDSDLTTISTDSNNEPIYPPAERDNKPLENEVKQDDKPVKNLPKNAINMVEIAAEALRMRQKGEPEAVKRDSDYLDLLDFISSLDSVKWLGENSWVAKCPAHDDAGQSLSVSISNDEGFVFKCGNGCAVEGIRRAFGFETSVPATEVAIPASTEVEVATGSEVATSQNKHFIFLRDKRLTEQVNAERLVRIGAGRLLYSFETKQWLCFDGQRWVAATTIIHQVAKKVALSFLADAAAETDEKYRKELYSHSNQSETWWGIQAMINMAKSEPEVQVKTQDLDSDIWLVNLLNGTFDLKRNLFREHRKEDLITRIAPVIYDPEGKAPIFEQFIAKIFLNNKEVMKFVQRVLGYALCGDCTEQKLFLFWGSGQNGKSTLDNTILGIFGDYGKQAPANLLLASKYDQHPTELAMLKGVRMIAASETAENRWLNESRIKDMTGGEKITARFMRGDFFSYTPEFKIFLATNHQPNIRCGDFGTQRRLVLVPFNYIVPAEELDTRLPDKLKAETPGIFNWLVEGFNMWKSYGLAVPDEITNATSSYIRDNDFIQAFLEEKCHFHDRFEVAVGALYVAYKLWAHQTGEPELDKRRFGMLMLANGWEQNNNGARKWEGLKLINPY
jgi:putative DNA primase/helicase